VICPLEASGPCGTLVGYIHRALSDNNIVSESYTFNSVGLSDSWCKGSYLPLLLFLDKPSFLARLLAKLPDA